MKVVVNMGMNSWNRLKAYKAHGYRKDWEHQKDLDSEIEEVIDYFYGEKIKKVNNKKRKKLERLLTYIYLLFIDDYIEYEEKRYVYDDYDEFIVDGKNFNLKLGDERSTVIDLRTKYKFNLNEFIKKYLSEMLKKDEFENEFEIKIIEVELRDYYRNNYEWTSIADFIGMRDRNFLIYEKYIKDKNMWIFTDSLYIGILNKKIDGLMPIINGCIDTETKKERDCLILYGCRSDFFYKMDNRIAYSKLHRDILLNLDGYDYIYGMKALKYFKIMTIAKLMIDKEYNNSSVAKIVLNQIFDNRRISISEDTNPEKIVEMLREIDDKNIEVFIEEYLKSKYRDLNKKKKRAQRKNIKSIQKENRERCLHLKNEGYSYSEIARKLNKTPQAISQLFKRINN